MTVYETKAIPSAATDWIDILLQNGWEIVSATQGGHGRTHLRKPIEPQPPDPIEGGRQ